MRTIDRYLPDGWSVEERPADQDFDGPWKEAHRWTDRNGLTIRRLEHDREPRFELQFFDEFRVDILPDRRLIAERVTDAFLDPCTRTHYRIDQVLPRILAFLGHAVLHAAAVRSEPGAIVFLGPSGLGKSTLSASFDTNGFGLIGDDALVASKSNGLHCVAPVYPSLRLFPDSIAALFPSPPASSTVMAASTKQRIEIPCTDTVPPDDAPIRAIFALEPPDDDCDIAIRQLSPAELCMALTENSFALDPRDCENARARLEATSSIANSVPGFSLRFPRDFEQLPRVRSSILARL